MSTEVQLGEWDGLACPEVGSWAETKYRLVSLYASLFSTGMKNKWDERIYIDLYAGAGYSQVRNSGKILLASPLLAMGVTDPFDKYVLCERDDECLAALRKRVERLFPNIRATFIPGDCNAKIDAISKEIPSGSRDHTALGLCFVDPFDLS